ncbi:MAG: hypothetical protein Fur0035_04840 [Anaerolineales bacterium]
MLRIKAAQDVIRRQERQLRDVLNSGLDGILVIDMQGRVLLANPAAAELLNRPRENLEGLEAGLPLTADDYTEIELLRPDGAQRIVEMRARLLDWRGGEQVWLVSLRDITERRQAEKVMREYNQRLEQAVEARTSELRETQRRLAEQQKLAVLGQLADSVGHELRGPLTVINNAVYLLRMIGADSSDKVKEYLAILENETRASEKIINDLIDFSNPAQPDLQPVEALSLLEQALQQRPAPANVRVEKIFPAGLPRVDVDPHQMVKVISNLLLNVYQAMPEGGLLSLTLERVFSTPPRLKILVRDSGAGIPPENLPKLFEPLFTTKAKGIGLGLAVSKKLVEANGGQITVEPVFGQGAAFALVLPVFNADSPTEKP